MRIRIHDYEKFSIELSYCQRNYVVNKMLEFQNVDTNKKYIEQFTKALVSNRYNRFDHV